MQEPKEIRMQREIDVWALRQKGWTHERIAKELHLERSAVTKILKRVRLKYAASLSEDVDQVRGEQIAQLNAVLEEALEAWERSKAAAKSLSKTTRPGKAARFGREAGPTEETTLRVNDQFGDPRYLQAALKAMEDIRKITGANAPDEVNLNWRANAERHGIQPSEAFEAMVQYYADQLAASDDERGGA